MEVLSQLLRLGLLRTEIAKNLSVLSRGTHDCAIHALRFLFLTRSWRSTVCGMKNAYTGYEATAFFGELSNTAKEEGQDRFEDFFRAPLFDSAMWTLRQMRLRVNTTKTCRIQGREEWCVEFTSH